MARKKCNRYSGIGGQAVLEGIMMKNKENYAVAVRKPDGEIEVELEYYQGVLHGHKIKELPFIRGIFQYCGFPDPRHKGVKLFRFLLRGGRRGDEA